MARSKRRGIKSSAQDNFLSPNCVTGLTVTNVPSGRAYNDGRIDLSWTNPTSGPTPTGYRVYRDGSLVTTVSHPTNTASITGLASATSYTFRVDSYNGNGQCTGTTSASVTATTVPATPSAPSASTVANVAQDSVSWTAPANGGSAITNYYWTSSDGKSGNTTSTSVTVNQEAGTAQTYNVRADNANGSSGTSANSGQVTTFSFTPFGFTPFGFTPFGFTPFGFTPFGFTPFGFTPFGFTPFSFSKGYKSVSANTLIKTTSGYIPAISLKVGDTLVAANITDNVSGQTLNQFQYGWSTNDATVDANYETTVMGLTAYFSDNIYLINGVKYTNTHYIYVKRPGRLNGINNTETGDDLIKFMNVTEIQETDLLWSNTLQDYVSIETLQHIQQRELVVCINVEPYDVFFVDNDILVHDSQPLEHIKQYVVETQGQDLSEALLILYQSVINEEQAISDAIAAVDKVELTLDSVDLNDAWDKVMILHSEPWELVEGEKPLKANLISRLNAVELQINNA